MSYNNCTYIGIRKQVTQHLYKFFSRIPKKKRKEKEEEKTEVLAMYQNHIGKVKMQRDHFRKQCENAKTNFSSLDVENKIRGIY
jgi:hypothetical protein